MLNLLKKYELQNVLIVVTRYFGGTLLGTGGLVRAYSDATINAIEVAQIVIQELGVELSVELQYSDFDYFQYYCQKNNILILKIQYADYINCIIEISLEEKEKILHEIEENSLKIKKIEIVKEKYIKRIKKD